MRKLDDQWFEELDGKMHMVKAVKQTNKCRDCVFCTSYWCGDPIQSEREFDCSTMIIKDLGVLNEDGCLPAPWDETKYPKITVLIGNVYNIEVINGHWFMQVRGDTLEKAVERWNRRT